MLGASTVRRRLLTSGIFLAVQVGATAYGPVSMLGRGAAQPSVVP
jgi:hypothetical protein